MTIRVMFDSKRRPGKRYVRTIQPAATYAWCVQCADDHRYDTMQGTCDAEDLPEAVRKAADARNGHFPSYVEWTQ
jgi:hypothetical protein